MWVLVKTDSAEIVASGSKQEMKATAIKLGLATENQLTTFPHGRGTMDAGSGHQIMTRNDYDDNQLD
jgi:hypothetical protein